MKDKYTKIGIREMIIKEKGADPKKLTQPLLINILDQNESFIFSDTFAVFILLTWVKLIGRKKEKRK